MVVSGFCLCPYQADSRTSNFDSFPVGGGSATLVPLPIDVLKRIQQDRFVLTSDNARSPPESCLKSVTQFSPVSRQASFNSTYRTNLEKHAEKALVGRRHISRWESDSRLERVMSMQRHRGSAGTIDVAGNNMKLRRMGGSERRLPEGDQLKSSSEITPIATSNPEPPNMPIRGVTTEGLWRRSVRNALDVSNHRHYKSLQGRNHYSEANKIMQGPPKMPVRMKLDLGPDPSASETMSLRNLMDLSTRMREAPLVESPRKKPPKMPVRKAFIDTVLTEAIAITSSLDVNG